MAKVLRLGYDRNVPSLLDTLSLTCYEENQSCLVVNCPMKEFICQGIERGSWPTVNVELRPSGQQPGGSNPVSNHMSEHGRRLQLSLQLKLQLKLMVWPQTYEGPWVWDSKVSCSQIPDPQILWGNKCLFF